jgi:glucosamine 6-phosphate synthetase-like amidotransferase/phosphosugar isomerase protein
MAGELKHGPLALVDNEMPMIMIVTRDPTYQVNFFTFAKHAHDNWIDKKVLLPSSQCSLREKSQTFAKFQMQITQLRQIFN